MNSLIYLVFPIILDQCMEVIIPPSVKIFLIKNGFDIFIYRYEFNDSHVS